MKKIVFCNGCFDLLHIGHMRLFEYASNLGEYVFVAINSDSWIQKYKGNKRPILNQNIRKEMIEHLKWVDKVVIFDTEKELDNLIITIQPDYLVKGIEYKGHDSVKKHYKSLSRHGGQIAFCDSSILDYSTTKIVDKILETFN
jgi:D-beta-D-heptose 7-phosphate kinase/D-beta-D-heptose 1-phosphate adenosyltransferase